MMRVLLLFVVCCFALFSQPEEKPVALYAGLGSWHHAIRTSSPEAQKYFDQGLALTYGFNRYEALRSFRKAAELDPQAAMAYWGVAAALGPYINMDGDSSYDIKQSCAAIDKGLALKSVSETERDWLQAAATRCPDFANPSRYITSMQGLAAKYPDDMDAQVFYADSLMIPVRWHWYSSDGKPAQGVPEAEQVLVEVLRRYPQHPGANHMYIHAVESSPMPELGIASAQRLMGIAPNEGHLMHMPAHIWLRLGDYENAIAVNQRAAEADRRYLEQTGVFGSYYMYYLHNLDFILYARIMQGRVEDTRHAAQQLMQGFEPMLQFMPEMSGLPSAAITMAELGLYRWDELIAAEKPKAEDAISVAMWRYSKAVALASTGQPDEARREQAEFERVRKGIDPNTPWGENKALDVMAMASKTLEARLAQSPAASIPLWKQAVELQDALSYDEPPAWYYPIRQSLAAATLRAGDAAGAESVFREALRRSPHNGRVLFGLIESLKAQKKSEAAAMVQHEFDEAWKGADLKLSIEIL